MKFHEKKKLDWQRKICKLLRILGVRKFETQKAKTNNEDIKQMKMPDEGEMKNPNMTKWRSQKIWQNEETNEDKKQSLEVA